MRAASQCLLSTSLLLGVFSAPIENCTTSTNPPESCIPCGNGVQFADGTSGVRLQNLPELSKLYGTYYTVATLGTITDADNSCTQVGFEPNEDGNLDYLAGYLASPKINQMIYPPAFGGQPPPFNVGELLLTAEDVDREKGIGDSDLPQYQLTVTIPIPDQPIVITSNLWILGAVSDGDDNYSAIVTYVCDQSNGAAQLFFLSRQPYLETPTVTYEKLKEIAINAIPNFDDFEDDLILVRQAESWCPYSLSTTTEPLSKIDCEKDLGAAPGVGVTTLVPIVAIVTSVLTMYDAW